MGQPTYIVTTPQQVTVVTSPDNAVVATPANVQGPKGDDGAANSQFTATVSGSQQIDVGHAVRVMSDGTVRPAGPGEAVGISLAANSPGFPVTVQTDGPLTIAGWNLVPGAEYYVDPQQPDGSLTTTPSGFSPPWTVQRVGRASAAGTLVVGIEPGYPTDGGLVRDAAGVRATGGGGSSAWGGVTGTLSAQTDLQTALNAKLDKSGGTVTGDLTVSGVINTHDIELDVDNGQIVGGGITISVSDNTITAGSFVGGGSGVTALNADNITGGGISGTGNMVRKSYVDAADALKATLASPALTGTPTVPTATAGTNTTQAASTAFVQAAVTALSTVYQPFDSDLTSWAGVTRASGFDTFVATPNSANLRTLLTDETGTGAAVFATSPTLVTPALGTPSGGNLANCTFPTLNQSTTGSAATLTTPRAINGVNFDGSAAITVPAAAGTLTGTTLNSTVVASSLTSFGNSPTFVTPILGTPTSGTLTNCTGLPPSGLTAPAKTKTITVTIGDGTNVPTVNTQAWLTVPWAGTITKATLLADASGSAVVNVWRDSYANYPPTVGDKITASAPPTLSSATKSQDSTLTGWTTAVAAGDTLLFNLDSVTTCKKLVLNLELTLT